jgi:hypothetical protein
MSGGLCTIVRIQISRCVRWFMRLMVAAVRKLETFQIVHPISVEVPLALGSN